MNSNLFVDFFTGLLTTILLFCFCFFVVVGAKSLQVFLHSKFLKAITPKPIVKPKKPKTTPKPKKVQPSVIKSIEIDPKEVDKIYVKRSS